MRIRALQLAVLFVAAVASSSAAGAAAAASYEDANVTVYGTDADLDSTAEVEAAVENGTAEPPEVVLVGDQLVVAVDSAALAADLDDREGTPTERFFAVLDGEPRLLVYQVNQLQAYDPWVFQLGPANTTAYRAGNTTYAVVDTGAVLVDRSFPEGDPTPPDAGQKYGVAVADNVADADPDGDEFTIVTEKAAFDHSGHYDSLPAAPVERPVEVHVEPEDRVLVNLSLDTGRTITEPVELTRPGGWVVDGRVTFDLDGVDPGTGYTLELVHDGEVVARRTGTVTEPAATISNVRFVEVDGERRLNLTARLSHGGAVVTETADGERRAVIDRIVPGARRQVSIPVQEDYLEDPDAGERLVPERGYLRAIRTGGPNDPPYPNGTYAIDGTEVRQGTLSPTATPTATPTAADGRATPDRTEDAPGFGPGLALLAVAVYAVLARRRR